MENSNGTVVAVGLLAMILGGAFAASPPPPSPTLVQPTDTRRDRRPDFASMSDDAVMLEMAADMGVNPPELQHACHYRKPDGTVKTGFAGLAIQGTGVNLMLVCPSVCTAAACRHYTIAHELAHFKHHQQGRRTSEPDADREAIDYLAAIGYQEAIRVKAESKYAGAAYDPGRRYAQQSLAAQGRQ